MQARPTIYQVVKEMIDKMGYQVNQCRFSQITLAIY